jgi:aminoglycoside phosphotransferase family enzyme/predicted kinase
MTGMSPDEVAQEPGLGVQARLVEGLRKPESYPHPVDAVRVIETHISFVFLTGPFAYKIKKSVDLGFLDFTTLEKRRLFCNEELRLNARLAPELYLDVVPICGAPEAPRVDGHGTVIEYAVKMSEFAQEALADRVLARGDLTTHHIDALAALVAEFHLCTQAARDDDGYGTPEAIWASIAQNFAQIRALPGKAPHLPDLDELEAWCRGEHRRLVEVFSQRKHEGRVRECHGDLHLGNIVLLDGAPRVFDCIEFNPELRWIDVMNEVAFLVMDLRAAGRAKFAARLLNAYLESTGDYGGLRVLRHYLVYRAMVRAKVNLMRARQLEPGSGEAVFLEDQFRRHVTLAKNSIRPAHPFLAITHGFSGSGKTTLTQPLVERTGAIRVRSDLERKRIHGLAPKHRSESGIGTGLYRPDATVATYERLLDLARCIIEAGHSVIVDATFLQRGQRDMFRALAARTGASFAIVDFPAGEDMLRQRVLARSERGEDASDADLAVLEHQLRTHQPLQADELESVFAYDASAPADLAERPQAWAALLQRLSAPSSQR